MKMKQARLLTSALVLTLGVQAPLLAQDAPPDDDVYVLDTFTVSTEKDRGYVAADSLAGGRQASPIRVTPASISSLTSEFLSDLGITNAQDALLWSLNSAPTSDRGGFSGGSGGGVFNYWSISSRGGQSVQGGNPPTKNYFPFFVISDNYNVDRIEFAQGPNSILFGIGDIGGAMTSYTKTARFDRDFNTATLSYNSYGGWRGTVDSNTAKDNLALRLNAVIADEKGFRDGDFNEKLGATLAGDWKFNDDRSHIKFEIEGWKQKKTIYGATYLDNMSLWDGTTSAATWAQAIPNLGANPLTTPGAPGVNGMSDWGLNPYRVIVAGSDTGVMNWSGGVRSMGTNNVGVGAYLRPEPYTYELTGTPIMALPSRDFAVAPSDAFLRPQAANATLTFEQRITPNLDLQVSGYHYVDKQYAENFEGGTTASIDLNQQLPNGSPNPNYGEIYSDYFLGRQVQNHKVTEFRALLSYHFDTEIFNVPLNQVLSVSAGTQSTDYEARQYNAQDISQDTAGWTSSNWESKLVWGRVYWNNPEAPFNLPDTVRYQPLPFNWFDFDASQDIDFVGAFSQSRFWDDRLNVTLGIRRDEFDIHRIGLRGTGNTPITLDGGGNTYSAGAIAYITEWLGVFANVSENFQPAAGGTPITLYGETLGASFGKGRNYGIRVSTKDNKYYATLTWYDQSAEAVIGGDSPGFQGIWDKYFQAGGTVTDIGPAGQVTGSPGSLKAAMQYVDTYDVEYEGVELELTANPTENIRLQIHYARPKGERTNNGPNGSRYFAEHLATWQAVAGGTSTPSQELATMLTTAQNDLARWAVPTLAGAVEKSHWNAFGVYSFTNDTLRGLEIGLGATHKGARQFNQTQRTTAFTTEWLMLAYTWNFSLNGREVPTRIQLNVDNVFGDDTLVFQNYEGNVPRDYNFIPPRKATLTVRFEF
jgi:outer membrane receptor protein involved in Fe transport